ncbi:MAG: CinA family nicotinamide mononucleotide deamidase-related protein [Phycisphaerales bacterium]|nr:CinA family nicotinamide mononucleotide deamidase-related protein [Phycisphaerales bacterium]
MKAAVLSIGDELLGGRIVDTNAAYLCRALAEIGIRTVAGETVGDERADIAAAAERLARCADIVVATGGLGPTPDDLTRWSLADLIDKGEVIDDAVALEVVRSWCTKHRLPVNEARSIVAKRPPSATFLTNDCGTAPGLHAMVLSAQTWWLPGPPNEMQSMFRRHVLPALSPTDTPLAPTEVRAVGLTEVQAADLLGDLLDRTRRPRLGIRVGGRVVRIAIDPVGEDVDAAAINSLAGEVYERLHPFVLPQDADNLFTAVGDALCKRKWTLATAESCTGGGIGSAVTSVIGSSAWYAGGWVTYANSMKMEQLAVPSWLFGQDKPGAVSSETVQAMAAGARERAGSDIAIAVSGVAGPDGGTLAKPVGTVWLGLAEPEGVHARRILVPGDRDRIRTGTIDVALQWVRWVATGDDAPLLWEWPE